MNKSNVFSLYLISTLVLLALYFQSAEAVTECYSGSSINNDVCTLGESCGKPTKCKAGTTHCASLTGLKNGVVQWAKGCYDGICNEGNVGSILGLQGYLSCCSTDNCNRDRRDKSFSITIASSRTLTGVSVLLAVFLAMF